MKQIILLFTFIGIAYTSLSCTGTASSKEDCFNRVLQNTTNNYCCYIKISDIESCIEYPKALKIEDIMKQYGYTDVSCYGKILKAGLFLLGMLFF